MDTKYQATVAVVTYRPNREKLLATLRSILLQKNIRLQIVIADDGSADPCFESVETLFKMWGFSDYVLVANPENRGTVYNLFSAVEKSEGAYIKAISPGDLLASETILQEWVLQIERSGADVSFSDAVYYCMGQNGPEAVISDAHPQDVNCYLRGNTELARYQYVVLGDLILGAALLTRRSILHRYLLEICGKAIYAEDHAYRIMIYDRIPVHYFAKDAVVYEIGTGISTSGSTLWQERLERDAQACSQIIMQRPCDSKDRAAADFRYLYTYKRRGLISKIIKFIHVPRLLLQRVKSVLPSRKTGTNLPLVFLEQVFAVEE